MLISFGSIVDQGAMEGGVPPELGPQEVPAKCSCLVCWEDAGLLGGANMPLSLAVGDRLGPSMM